MIINPFYYGMMKIKGKLHEGAHEPLITKKLFDDCQKIKGIRSQSALSKKKGHIPKPFMGFAKCHDCGHAVTGESRKKASGKVYVYYHCAKNKCPQYKIRIEQKGAGRIEPRS